MILLLAPLIAIAAIAGVALVLRVQRGGQRQLVGRVVENGVRAGQLPHAEPVLGGDRGQRLARGDDMNEVGGGGRGQHEEGSGNNRDKQKESQTHAAQCGQDGR